MLACHLSPLLARIRLSAVATGSARDAGSRAYRFGDLQLYSPLLSGDFVTGSHRLTSTTAIGCHRLPSAGLDWSPLPSMVLDLIALLRLASAGGHCLSIHPHAPPARGQARRPADGRASAAGESPTLLILPWPHSPPPLSLAPPLLILPSPTSPPRPCSASLTTLPRSRTPAAAQGRGGVEVGPSLQVQGRQPEAARAGRR